MARKKVKGGGELAADAHIAVVEVSKMKTWLYISIAVVVGFLLATVGFWVWSRPKENVQVVVVETDKTKINGNGVGNRGTIANGAPPVYPEREPEYPLRGVPQDYQQVGILVGESSDSEEPVLLALFGRPKEGTRDRWEYYVSSDKYHLWRLPVQQKNRVCDEDVGCEEIYQGDDVVVPDYGNKAFKARIYKYAPVRRN